MSRKPRVAYRLDATGVQRLAHADIVAILRGAGMMIVRMNIFGPPRQ